MQNALNAGPTAPRHRRAAVALLLLLVAVILSPPALIAFAFWVASASWEFSGTGVRHWIFVKGSTIDRLGFVSAADAPARYVVRIQEGTDPGAISITYDSNASPADVAAEYAKRCRTMGLEIKKQTADEDAVEATLVCEAKPEAGLPDDIWVVAERPRRAAMTEVNATAGPGLTGIYNF